MNTPLPDSLPASAVNLSFLADARSSGLASSVLSRPCRNSRILAGLISKPVVEYFLPNSTASGNPTYPSPMTAILVRRRLRMNTPQVRQLFRRHDRSVYTQYEAVLIA